MTGAILIVIGVVALFAAIVGGGIKIRDIEVGSVPSIWRQGLLALFGLVVGLIGLMMYVDESPDAADSGNAAAEYNAAAEPVAAEAGNTDDANAADANTVDANTVDANAADANSADPAAQ